MFDASKTSEYIASIQKVIAERREKAEKAAEISGKAFDSKYYESAAEWMTGNKFNRGSGDPVRMMRGIERMARAGGLTIEQLIDRFSITSERTAGYLPVRAFENIAQLGMLFAGADDSNAAKRMAGGRLVNNNFESALHALEQEFRAKWKNSQELHNGCGAYRDCKVEKMSVDLGAAIGYRRLIDKNAREEEIDAAIDAGAADFQTTTINAAESKVKSLLLCIGAAVVLKDNVDPVTGEVKIVEKERDYMGKSQKIGMKPSFGCALMNIAENYAIFQQGGRFGATKK